ncbi:MAG: ubiquinone biosynthesis regulatory protein kinase UbiB [Pseudomonadota bacterium]
MSTLRQFYRLININIVFLKHGLDDIVTNIPVFKPLKIFTYLNPYNWKKQKRKPQAVRIREALEELGPIFVKFGQVLSTRADIFPDDIVKELEKLQDQVPSFATAEAKKIIYNAYGKNVEDLFAEFSETPLASASIAQVHTVKLLSGQDAVIKILRPNIEKTIRRDVDLMLAFAKLIDKYWSQAKRLHPIEIVKEFEHVIFNELDLVREAANASQIRHNFRNQDILYTPEIYWEYATERCIVMEKIYGIPITDVEELKNYNINLKKLAELGVEIFFTQVFRDSFFHADMHAGNIFVNPNRAENPQYIGIDFGIVGTLNKEDQRYLAENFVAFFNRDYYRVAQLHVDSGWVPANTRVDELASDVRAVCEPIMGKPLSQISFGKMLLRLFQIGKRYNMDVQPQLMLLQKTLLSIEGLGRRLYPDLDLWNTAKPFLEKWLRSQRGGLATLKHIAQELPMWVERMPEMPGLLYDALQTVKQRKNQPEVLIQEKKLNKTSFISFGLAIGFLVSFILTLQVAQMHQGSDYRWLAEIEIIAAIIFFIIGLFKR